jgi:hypothetical protein
LGPVAFIVHINGLPSALAKRERTFDNEVSEDDDDDVTIFMDDITISEIIDVKKRIPGNVIGNAERNMTEVMKFTKQQKMELNLKKCKEMLIDSFSAGPLRVERTRSFFLKFIFPCIKIYLKYITII